MARSDIHREDLFAEATALRERAEWLTDHSAETIVAGFRPEASLSLYFGDRMSFQFDPNGQLRRAFVDGRLYRSHGSMLAELVRKRSADRTELHRTDLDGAPLQQFLASVATTLAALLQSLAHGDVQVLRQMPPGHDLRPKVREVLTAILSRPLELSPPIAARR